MREHSATFDNVLSDSRFRCILCESVLPAPTAAVEHNSVCLRCWALAPDDRRLLRDRAMTQVLRRDLTRWTTKAG